MTDREIREAFSYHAPTGDQPASYEDIRGNALLLAENIQWRCPESREKSLALTKLREAVMWANASIAINGLPVLTETGGGEESGPIEQASAPVITRD